MRRILLSFGSSNLKQQLDRVASQAEAMGGYDEIICADESHLNAAFRRKFRRYLKTNVRGFGYWCWKPEIILQTLLNADEGDIVQYIDVGCHLNANGRQRLDEYFEIASQTPTGILAFQSGLQCDDQPALDPSLIWIDKNWCKGDLLDHLGARGSDYLDAGTIVSGSIFFRRCEKTMNLVRVWSDVMHHDMRLVDDRSSRTPNPPGFREHRHDQAVFSLLCKQNGAALLSYSEVDVPATNGVKNWERLDRHPIHTRRDWPRTKWSRYAALSPPEKVYFTLRSQLGLRWYQIKKLLAKNDSQTRAL